MALVMLPSSVVHTVQPAAMGVLLGQGWNGFMQTVTDGSAASIALSIAAFLIGMVANVVLCSRSPSGGGALRRTLFWMSCTLTGGLQAIAQIRLRVGKFKANEDALVLNAALSSICLGVSLPHVAVKLVTTPHAEVVLPFLLTLLLTEAICSNTAMPLIRIGVSVLLLLAGLQGVSKGAGGLPGDSATKKPQRAPPASGDRGVDSAQASETAYEPFLPATVVRSRRYSPNYMVSRRPKASEFGSADSDPLVCLVDRAAEAAPNMGTRRAKGDGRANKRVRGAAGRSEGGSDDVEGPLKADDPDERHESDVDDMAVESEIVEDDALLNGVPCFDEDAVEPEGAWSDEGGDEDSRAVAASNESELEARQPNQREGVAVEEVADHPCDSGMAQDTAVPRRVHKGLDFEERRPDRVLAELMAANLSDDDDDVVAPSLKMAAPATMGDSGLSVSIDLNGDAFPGRLRPEAQTFEPSVFPMAPDALPNPGTAPEPQPPEDTALNMKYAPGVLDGMVEDGPFQEMRAGEKIAEWRNADQWSDVPASAWMQGSAADGGANGDEWGEYAAQSWQYGGHSSMSGRYYGSYAAEHQGSLSADAPVFVPGQASEYGHGPWATEKGPQDTQMMQGPDGVTSLVDPAVPDPGPGRASQVRRGDAGFGETRGASWDPRGTDDPQASVLCLGDVEEWMTDAFITGLFANMAYVTSVTRLPGGYAYVQLDSSASAVYVMDMLGGGPIQARSGHIIRVNWADNSGYDADGGCSWQAGDAGDRSGVAELEPRGGGSKEVAAACQ